MPNIWVTIRWFWNILKSTPAEALRKLKYLKNIKVIFYESLVMCGDIARKTVAKQIYQIVFENDFRVNLKKKSINY